MSWRPWAVGLLAVPVSVIIGGCSGGSKHGSATPTTVVPFIAPDAGFSAVFPAPPKRQVVPVQQPGISMDVVYYEATTNHEQVAVVYTTTPGAPAGPAVQTSLDDAIDVLAVNLKGNVSSRANTTYLAQPAEDGVISAPGAVVHARVVYFGTRRYLLEGITSAADTPHPHFDALVATFKTR